LRYSHTARRLLIPPEWRRAGEREALQKLAGVAQELFSPALFALLCREREDWALGEGTAFVRLQSFDSPRVLLRLPIAGQTADESPSPSGKGRASGSEQPTARRGEGESSESQQRSVIWQKQVVARLSLTLDPSLAGRGKQQAGASKLVTVAGHFSSMPNIRTGEPGRERLV